MLTDLQRDILIKSAEGIQEGMWCIGSKFEHSGTEGMMPLLLNNSVGFTVEDAARTRRCALGELEFRTALAGGSRGDFCDLVDRVGRAIAGQCPDRSHMVPSPQDLAMAEHEIVCHNDGCLSDHDSFSAGQEWARIFRVVAES